MIREIIVAAVVGWIVSEATDISPWVAIRLGRWAANNMYPANAERAARRREEWEALINESIPSKTAKLFFGLGLGCAGLCSAMGRRMRLVLARVAGRMINALPDIDDVAEWVAQGEGCLLLMGFLSLSNDWQLIIMGGIPALCGIGAGLAWLFTLPRATRKYRRVIFGPERSGANAVPAAVEPVITPHTSNPGC